MEHGTLYAAASDWATNPQCLTKLISKVNGSVLSIGRKIENLRFNYTNKCGIYEKLSCEL